MEHKKIKRGIGILLIAAGVGLMVYALYAKYSVERKKDDLVVQYENYINWVSENDLDIEEIEEAVSDSPAPEQPTDEVISSPPITFENMPIPRGIIGIMEIEKIGLTVTMAEGTDNRSITLSVGHFPKTAMPGQKGNFAVVGHRSYRYGAYFNRLNELTTGDLVKVKTANGIFTYCVDSQFVVEPTDTWVLDPTEEATMTLVTCTPIRTATHRLIIKGHLVE